MSDDRLREAERRWKHGGGEEAAEAYLVERIRAEGWPIRRVVEESIRVRRVLSFFLARGRGVVMRDEDLSQAARADVLPSDILEWLDRGRDSLQAATRDRPLRSDEPACEHRTISAVARRPGEPPELTCLDCGETETRLAERESEIRELHGRDFAAIRGQVERFREERWRRQELELVQCRTCSRSSTHIDRAGERIGPERCIACGSSRLSVSWVPAREAAGLVAREGSDRVIDGMTPPVCPSVFSPTCDDSDRGPRCDFCRGRDGRADAVAEENARAARRSRPRRRDGLPSSDFHTGDLR